MVLTTGHQNIKYNNIEFGVWIDLYLIQSTIREMTQLKCTFLFPSSIDAGCWVLGTGYWYLEYLTYYFVSERSFVIQPTKWPDSSTYKLGPQSPHVHFMFRI